MLLVDSRGPALLDSPQIARGVPASSGFGSHRLPRAPFRLSWREACRRSAALSTFSRRGRRIIAVTRRTGSQQGSTSCSVEPRSPSCMRIVRASWMLPVALSPSSFRAARLLGVQPSPPAYRASLRSVVAQPGQQYASLMHLSLTRRSSGPRGEAIVFPDVLSARGRLTRR
jgi:hypothetical protein